ncbi:hypothetical protein LCL95_12885 [Bacillus timonensis]|nr:hypothetical protein [Bacillus timonensis]
MTLQFTRKHIILLLFSFSILVGMTYLLLIVLVSPIEAKVEQLKQSVSMEQKYLDILQEKRSNTISPDVSSTEIQKQIPVIPLVEQLMLQLERAEMISNSKILSVSFTETPYTLPTSVDDSQNTENTTESNTSVVDPTVFDPSVLDGLMEITATLTVESPNYFDLAEFLSLIEHQTRITKVTTLTFTGNQEIISADQEVQPLQYSITISSFYMPKFKELAEDAPKIEVPSPSNKINPLNADIKEEDE